nr:hypothetical protein [Tanacetum cinerariifolium]
MSKDLSIPRRNKVNWHYVRDDHMFSTIKLVSRHQNTQQFSALLPIELTNDEIRNSNAYKEYYAVATGTTPPKPKASVRKTRSSFDTTVTPPTTAAGLRLTTSAKGKQAAKATKAKSLSALSEMKELVLYQGFLIYPLMSQRKNSPRILQIKKVMMLKERMMIVMKRMMVMMVTKEMEVERDDEEEGGDDAPESDDEETRDEESFDPIPQTPEISNDEGNGEEDLGLNVGKEERYVEEEDEDELYKDVNINQGRGIQATLKVEDSYVTLTPVNHDGMESIFETASQMDVQTPTSVAPLLMSAPTMTSSTITTITTTSQALFLPTTTLSTIIQDLPNFRLLFGFDNRPRTLEANFFEFMQTNQFARAVSAIFEIF